MIVRATQPYFSAEDIDFITEHFAKILQGESFLSMHRYGEQFEQAFARKIGVKYAVACNSGTAALEMICRALDLRGREVILPSNTFVATANAILNAGAEPVFADCGDDMCLSAESVRSRITDRTGAVMHVHIGGIVSPAAFVLRAICEERGIPLIEDAAQAHGSRLAGVSAGAIGRAAGFSFFSTKVMTTGEGGMVTTDDEELATHMRSLREFGKVRDDIYVNVHRTLGYNWRMPEVSALMGLRQLASLDGFLARRREIASIYDKEFAGHKAICPVAPFEPESHNFFKYIVVLPEHDRAWVHRQLAERGVQPSGYVYELPLHMQPIFPDTHSLLLPGTQYFCARHLCLPIYVGMTDDQVHYVARTLRQILESET